MSRDLILGRTRRNWSIGDVPPAQPAAPTRDEELTRLLLDPPVQPPKSKSPTDLVLAKAREAAPGAMKLYDEYRPTYRDHQVVIRHKI